MAQRIAHGSTDPSQYVPDDGPSGRLYLFDLAKHPIVIERVNGTVKFCVKQPRVQVEQESVVPARNSVTDRHEQCWRGNYEAEVGMQDGPCRIFFGKPGDGVYVLRPCGQNSVDLIFFS